MNESSPQASVGAIGVSGPKTRLDQLFCNHLREVSRELYATEVAAAMADLGEPVTDTYLRTLRYGPKRFNPSDAKRRALATVFGVRPEDLPPGSQGRAALDRLWRTKLVTERKQPTNREVSEWLQRYCGVTVTPRYIQQLRDDVADNPSAAIMNALAAYFDVSVDYLLNGHATAGQPHVRQFPSSVQATYSGRERVSSGTASTAARRSKDDEVRLMAMRLLGVSPQGRAFIASVIDDVRGSENLDPPPPETAK